MQAVSKDRTMAENDLRAYIGRPVPAALAEDVKRVWSFMAAGGATSSVSLKLLAGLCEANANVLAVSFRAMLVDILLQQSRLDRWRQGKNLSEKVFGVAASFPLPRGLENADPDAFIAALESSRLPSLR
jgi:hypothetical protein